MVGRAARRSRRAARTRGRRRRRAARAPAPGHRAPAGELPDGDEQSEGEGGPGSVDAVPEGVGEPGTGEQPAAPPTARTAGAAVVRPPRRRHGPAPGRACRARSRPDPPRPPRPAAARAASSEPSARHLRPPRPAPPAPRRPGSGRLARGRAAARRYARPRSPPGATRAGPARATSARTITRVELRPRAPLQLLQRRRHRPGPLYERVEVIASKASATATTRANSGICPPASPYGYPLPSSRSWWCRIADRASPRKPMPRTISCPYSGCSSMTRRSSRGERPVLAQQPGGHAELADVVQDPGEAQHLEPVLVHAQLAGDHRGGLADPLAVAAGVAVLDVDGLHQRADGGLVGGALPVVLGEDPAGDVHRQQHEQRGRPARTGCATARPSSARRGRARSAGARERGEQPAPGGAAAGQPFGERPGSPPSRAVSTRQKASAAAAGGQQRVREVGQPRARPAAPRRRRAASGPQATRAQTATASCAARQTRRSRRGPLLDPGQQGPGQRDERGGGGRQQEGRRRAARGRRCRCPRARRRPSGGQTVRRELAAQRRARRAGRRPTRATRTGRRGSDAGAGRARAAQTTYARAAAGSARMARSPPRAPSTRPRRLRCLAPSGSLEGPERGGPQSASGIGRPRISTFG